MTVTRSHVTGAIRKFGSIIFGLTCAPAAFHAYKSMERRSDADWRDVCTGAVGAGALLLGSYGLGGSIHMNIIMYSCIFMDISSHVELLTCFVLVCCFIYVTYESQRAVCPSAR